MKVVMTFCNPYSYENTCIEVMAKKMPLNNETPAFRIFGKQWYDQIYLVYLTVW